MKLSDLVTFEEFQILNCKYFGSCVKWEDYNGFKYTFRLDDHAVDYINFLEDWGKNTGWDELIELTKKLRLLNPEELWFVAQALDFFSDFREQSEEEDLEKFETWQPEGVFDPYASRPVYVQDVLRFDEDEEDEEEKPEPIWQKHLRVLDEEFTLIEYPKSVWLNCTIHFSGNFEETFTFKGWGMDRELITPRDCGACIQPMICLDAKNSLMSFSATLKQANIWWKGLSNR